jgi:hypothetical protein
MDSTWIYETRSRVVLIRHVKGSRNINANKNETPAWMNLAGLSPVSSESFALAA